MRHFYNKFYMYLNYLSFNSACLAPLILLAALMGLCIILLMQCYNIQYSKEIINSFTICLLVYNLLILTKILYNFFVGSLKATSAKFLFYFDTKFNSSINRTIIGSFFFFITIVIFSLLKSLGIPFYKFTEILICIGFDTLYLTVQKITSIYFLIIVTFFLILCLL